MVIYFRVIKQRVEGAMNSIRAQISRLNNRTAATMEKKVGYVVYFFYNI